MDRISIRIEGSPAVLREIEDTLSAILREFQRDPSVTFHATLQRAQTFGKNYTTAAVDSKPIRRKTRKQTNDIEAIIADMSAV